MSDHEFYFFLYSRPNGHSVHNYGKMFRHIIFTMSLMIILYNNMADLKVNEIVKPVKTYQSLLFIFQNFKSFIRPSSVSGSLPSKLSVKVYLTPNSNPNTTIGETLAFTPMMAGKAMSSLCHILCSPMYWARGKINCIE